jgi:hypothetical protein
LLDPRLFQPLLQDRQALVEGHPGLKQVRQLFGKNEQLTMGNLQVLRCRNGTFRRFSVFARGGDWFDANRNATLLLDLANCDRSIWAIQYSFNQPALRIAGSIGKLWHRAGKLLQATAISKSRRLEYFYTTTTKDGTDMTNKIRRIGSATCLVLRLVELHGTEPTKLASRESRIVERFHSVTITDCELPSVIGC